MKNIKLNSLPSWMLNELCLAILDGSIQDIKEMIGFIEYMQRKGEPEEASPKLARVIPSKWFS